MEYRLAGYCGLYCAACPIMLGTKNGTEANPCHGCKSAQPAGHCADCGIKACAQSKGYAFCLECGELTTCDLMRVFMNDPQWPYHKNVIRNLETIRRTGVDSWLKAQDRRWRCSDCGAAHSWWDETCPQCSRPVSSYKADQ